MLIVGVFTIFLILAKGECVLGSFSKKKSFLYRNILITAFIFIAEIIYISYMLLILLKMINNKEYTDMSYCIGLTF